MSCARAPSVVSVSVRMLTWSLPTISTWESCARPYWARMPWTSPTLGTVFAVYVSCAPPLKAIE